MKTNLLPKVTALILLCTCCTVNCDNKENASGPCAQNTLSHTTQFTLVNWNLQTFFDGNKDGFEYSDFQKAGNWNIQTYTVRLQRLCQFISQVNADIYVFEEIENEAVIHDISNQLAANGHNWNQKKFWNYSAFAKQEETAIGLGIISRFPLNEVKAHALDIRIHNQAQPSTRYLLEAAATIGGQKVILLANHWKSKSGGEEKSEIWRDWQESLLAKRIAELCVQNTQPQTQAPPIIITGDFNRDAAAFICSFEEAGSNTILRFADYGSADYVQARSLWFTPEGTFATKTGSYWYDDQWERIDNIMLTGNITAAEFRPMTESPWANAQGIPFGYKIYSGEGWSDHLPLWASLVLSY
ncbi:MAG: endonuclease/exonuclease/phosphatase family protein [Treponema sp.]|nr:endonuclease/exonuclease/phosphatase family protein [Treponema sp.]